MYIENFESFPAMKALDVLSRYPVISFTGRVINHQKSEISKKGGASHILTIAHPGGEVPINYKMKIIIKYLPDVFLKSIDTKPWVTVTGKIYYDEKLDQFSLRAIKGIPFFIPRDFEKYYKE